MDEINYRKKKQFMKKRLGVFAAAIVLIIGVSMVGIQYTRFVSKTVYQESTSHLTEIFHQSNKALNELVNKNLTYLHMWSAYLQKASTEKEICDYINKVQEETGFSGFYFLSFDGNYKTITGETGYLGLQGNLDDKITQRNDIIMNAHCLENHRCLFLHVLKLMEFIRGLNMTPLLLHMTTLIL